MTAPAQAGRHRTTSVAARRNGRVRTAALAVLVAVGAVVGLATPVAAGAAPTSPTQRLLAIAARYVGHARYREGGASPRTGFDCSGYTMYVYAQAHVAKLPHNAETQMRMHHMHRVAAKQRRKGDLVFYLSGGAAYHVAIYAGHGMQYAAATPRDGIRYQHVWSKAVRYGRYVR